MERLRLAMSYNEKGFEIQCEIFGIDDPDSDGNLSYLRVAKTQLTKFKILARQFKRDESLEQFRKTERIYLNIQNG